MQVTYGSVCSGVEAASLAWEPLGYQPLWFSEIDEFPKAVLAQRWPHVPDLGNMLNLRGYLSSSLMPSPDVLVGGTPCQSFSLSGLRNGLNDERGQLTLEYIRILNEIDKQRTSPCVAVWENVPGVLTSKDNAFGCFLAGLVGDDQPVKLPSGRKWSNSGVIVGPQRTAAWRVLDAQYFGVAQRRRRVFVVTSARKGFCPAQVLLEPEGMRRDFAPSREAGEEIAKCLTARPNLSHREDRDTLIPFDMQGFGKYGSGKTASTIKARDHKDATDLITYPINDKATRHQGSSGRGSGNGLGVGTQHDPCPTLTTGDKHAVFAFAQNSRNELRLENGDGQIIGAISSGGGKPGQGYPAVAGRYVRRLTPRECERLQGMPDDHTRIEWNGKSLEDCPDGHRYKAIGNSMAVPVMRWIGERLIHNLKEENQ